MAILVGDDPVASIYNIIVDQGETFTRTFTWTDGTGALVNLTGGTSTFSVKKIYPKTFLTAAHADAAVISLTQASGITLGGAAGTITPLVTAAAILAITPGIYNYQCIVTLSSTATIISEGLFEIRQGT